MTAPPKPIYVPYLSPAGPLPATPVAEALEARLFKLRAAHDALIAAGEEEMADQIRAKLEDGLTPAERELLVIAKWARETSEKAAFIEAAKDQRDAKQA